MRETSTRVCAGVLCVVLCWLFLFRDGDLSAVASRPSAPRARRLPKGDAIALSHARDHHQGLWRAVFPRLLSPRRFTDVVPSPFPYSLQSIQMLRTVLFPCVDVTH